MFSSSTAYFTHFHCIFLRNILMFPLCTSSGIEPPVHPNQFLFHGRQSFFLIFRPKKQIIRCRIKEFADFFYVLDIDKTSIILPFRHCSRCHPQIIRKILFFLPRFLMKSTMRQTTGLSVVFLVVLAIMLSFKMRKFPAILNSLNFILNYVLFQGLHFP